MWIKAFCCKQGKLNVKLEFICGNFRAGKGNAEDVLVKQTGTKNQWSLECEVIHRELFLSISSCKLHFKHIYVYIF